MTQPAVKPQARGWTPARRARQSAAIRSWSPWRKSTGPRTRAGKARASQNAVKLECHAQRMMNKALAAQQRYLVDIQGLIALKKIGGQNELLKKIERNLHRRLLRQGMGVIKQLRRAILLNLLCKNLAKPSPLGLKVNAYDA